MIENSISIYRQFADGHIEKIFATPINEGSIYSRQLMSEDYIILKFSLTTPIYFQLGDYCDTDFGRFELVDSYRPSFNVSTGGYDYELRLDAEYYKWKNKLFKYRPEYGGQEASWTLTDKIDVFMTVFLANLSAHGYKYKRNADYTVIYEDGIDFSTRKPITFSETNLIDALTVIAEQWECEWWIVNQEIHFGKCQLGIEDDAIDFEDGVNVENMSPSTSSDKYISRLFVFGGTTNIPARYRKRLIFDIKKKYYNTFQDTARMLSWSFFSNLKTKDETPMLFALPDGHYTDGPIWIAGASLGSQEPGRRFILKFPEPIVVRLTRTSVDNVLREALVIVRIKALHGDKTIIKEKEIVTEWSKRDTNMPTSSQKTFNIDIPDFEWEIDEGELAYYSIEVEPKLCDLQFMQDTFPVYRSLLWAEIGLKILSGPNAGEKIYAAKIYNGTYVDPSDGIHLFTLGTRYEIINIPGKSQLIRSKVPASYFTQDYETETTLTGIVEQHLMLPETWNEGKNYIDAKEDLTEEERVEGILVLTDVYPKTECEVTQVDSYQTEQKDDATGAGTGIWNTYYLINDNNITLEKYYILPNVSNFSILFTSGKLSDMEFEINLLKAGDQLEGNVKLSDGTIGVYKAKGQMFHILANNKYGRTLPDDLLFPQKDDTFVLRGYDPDFFEDMGLVVKAEEELLERGQKAMQKYNIDPNTYTCPLYWWKAKEYGNLSLGQRVNLISEAYFPDGDRQSRIIGFTIKLDMPHDTPEYTVGESASYSRIGNLENKLNEIVLNGNTYVQVGNMGDGSLYIIKTDSLAASSENNVYSAKRSDKQFLRKDIEDKANELITFAKGLRSEDVSTFVAGIISILLSRFAGGASFGEYEKGISGAIVDGNGLSEFAETLVRGLLTADTAKIREVLDTITFDDVATFVQGLKTRELYSDDWESGLRGFGVYHKQSGKSYMEVDELLVRVKAIFNELEIRKLSYVGGNIELSGAGSKIYKVTPIEDEDGTVVKYRCYLIRDDGTTRTRNWWQVGDMAKCQTFNLDSELREETADNGVSVPVWREVSNRYYWRAVIAVGEETLDDGNVYNYIDLANTAEVVLPTWVDGEEVPMTYQGMDNVFEDFNPEDVPDANDAPIAGDEIVQEGNLVNEDRQHMIRLCVVGENAPSIEEYVGVKTYELAPYRKTMIAPRTGDVFVAKRFEIMTENGSSYRVPCDRGEYTKGMVCYYYDRVSLNGALWLCISKEGNVLTDQDGFRMVIAPSASYKGMWQKQVDKGADGADGKDTFVVDIDNEMTSIPLSEDGTVAEAIELSFGVSAHYGLTDVTGNCSISLVGNTPAGWTVNLNAATSPKVSIDAGASPAPTTSFRFKVSHPTYGSRNVTFSVAAIRAGGIGQDAVIYELLPSASALYVSRDDNGNFSPGTVSLTCGYVKRVGQNPAETVENAISIFDGYNIYFIRRNRETGAYETYYRKYTSYKSILGNLNVSTYDMVEFVISRNTGLMVKAEELYGVIDRESIPIITDGSNGENAINIVVTGGDVIFNGVEVGRRVYVEFFDGTERIDYSDAGFSCSGLSDNHYLCDNHIYWTYGTDEDGKRFYYQFAYDGFEITPTDVPFTVTDKRTNIPYTRHIRISNVSDSLVATLSPETVILTQSPADGSIDLKPACTEVKVYKGVTDVTGDATISISAVDGCVAGIKENTTDVIAVTSLIGQPDTGSVAISITYKGITIQRTFSFAVNYLGKFKETIENDVKTQIASKEFSYFDENGEVHTSAGISEIIQSSEEISQRVEKVEDGLLAAKSEIVQQADRITLGVYGHNVTRLYTGALVRVLPGVNTDLALDGEINSGDELVITCRSITPTTQLSAIYFIMPDGEQIIKEVVKGETDSLLVSKIISTNLIPGSTLGISSTASILIGFITVAKRESVNNGLNRTGIDISNGTIHLQADKTIIDSDVTVASLQTVPTTEGAYIKMSGSELSVYGWNEKPSIVFGVDKTNGCAILRFCDAGGRPMYNLGPGGLSSIVNTAVPDSWGNGVDCIKTHNGQKSSIVIRPIPGVSYTYEWSGTTYYQFNEGRFASESSADPVLAHGGRFDGKWYSTQEVKGDSYGENRGEPISESNLIPDGWYGGEITYSNRPIPRIITVRMRKFIDGRCVAVKDMDFGVFYYMNSTPQEPIVPDRDYDIVQATSSAVARKSSTEVLPPLEPVEPMPTYWWLESITPDTVSGLE